jgi:DNA helicase-2/ATP-dependent DNA helicase PcrA
VLVRTNAQTAAIAEACGTAGVPHRVRGAGSLLEFPEVKDALDSIRRSPSLEVALADLAADVDRRNRRALRSDGRAPGGRPSGPARDADDAVEGPGAPGEPDGSGTDVAIDDRAANVAEVVRLGHEYRSLDPTGGTGGFIAWLVSTLRNEDAASGGDAVEIVTFHAAKGLEWSTVHVAGLEQGLVPIHHAQDDPDSVDEERRLLYVALTRARESLHCHWARRRTFGTRASRRSPSPWLDAIATAVGAGGNELTPAQSARRAAGARSGGARQRTASSSTDLVGTDRALFERLRSWRRDQARAADVPAFVIFNDAVLQEVARRRPDDRAALLEVPGIGPVKAERFGDDLLEIVAGAD